ncbi:MAG: NosD domain-containing protein [Candidatus Bathyarchaeia archaeon]
MSSDIEEFPMIHRKVVFLLLPVICLSILGFVRFEAKASSTTIRVPQDYPTIQQAINHANPGDTVSVSAGTYYESLTIDKNLALTGENRENTVLNGMGGDYGIQAISVNVVITGFKILNATTGIYVEQSYGSIISHNDITASQTGIWLHYSNSSTVSDNVVHDVAWSGIVFCGGSSENTITLNDVTNCGNGIVLSGEGNSIFHNNFVNNQNQVDFITSNNNSWDDGSRGNYWSDYLTKYPNAAEVDSSGVWNTPYVIDTNNVDHYPLILDPIAPTYYTLTIQTTPCSGWATDYGTTTPSGVNTYPSGSMVEVIAHPSPGWYFDSWILDSEYDVTTQGNTITITMNSDHVLWAIFNPIQSPQPPPTPPPTPPPVIPPPPTTNVTLTVLKFCFKPVTYPYGDISPDVGTYTVPVGTNMTFTAIDNAPPWKFYSWNFNGQEIFGNTITVTVTTDSTLYAMFMLSPTSPLHAHLQAISPPRPLGQGYAIPI